MAGTRLLERLNGSASKSSARRRRDEQQVRESVSAHVRKLLNTRRGNVPIDPSFGMPDVSRGGNSGDGHARDEIDNAIRALIERYEPRLSDVQVASNGLSKQGFGIGIEVKGTVTHGNRTLSVRVVGTILPDGRFAVDEGARA